MPHDAITPDKGARRRELVVFLFLSFIFWPLLTIALVGGYGLIVWLYQWIYGPPGPLT